MSSKVLGALLSRGVCFARWTSWVWLPGILKWVWIFEVWLPVPEIAFSKLATMKMSDIQLSFHPLLWMHIACCTSDAML